MPTSKVKVLGRDGRPVRRASAAPLSGVLSRNTIDFVHQLNGFLANPDKISLRTYERMKKTDETISAALEFLRLSVVSRLGEYTHENETIQEFVRLNFDQMRGCLTSSVGEMLSAMWAGFSATEIVWRFQESEPDPGSNLRPIRPGAAGSIMLDSLQTMMPSSVVFHVDTSGGPEHGEVDLVHQWFRSAWHVSLPKNKVIVYSHRQEFGNPYGTSRLQCVYKNWWMKDVLLKAWARTLERYGAPLAIGTTPDINGKVKDHAGKITTRGQQFLTLLSDLHDNAAMVKNPDEIVEIVQAQRPMGPDFESCINYLNRMMLRGGLVPSLIFDNTDIGSHALGEKHFDVLVLALEHLLNEVSSVLIEQLVRWIIFFNFGPQENWGQFQTLALEPEDLEKWANIVEKLTGAKILSAKRLEDRNSIRERFGFDLLEEADLEKEAEQSTPMSFASVDPPSDPEEDANLREELRAELIEKLKLVPP